MLKFRQNNSIKKEERKPNVKVEKIVHEENPYAKYVEDHKPLSDFKAPKIKHE